MVTNVEEHWIYSWGISPSHLNRQETYKCLWRKQLRAVRVLSDFPNLCLVRAEAPLFYCCINSYNNSHKLIFNWESQS